MSFAALGVVLATAALGLSAALTGIVRRYALSSQMLDRPNTRSSHTHPVPRGGGLAIAIVTFAGTIAGTLIGIVPRTLATALVGGGVIVAAVGWADDRRGLRTGVRLIAHFVAASWATVWIGSPHSVRIGPWTLFLGLTSRPLAIIAIAWSINLYNFMDGIDGLAAIECVIGVGALALISSAIGATEIAFIGLLLAAAAGGFAFWNWAPAKIFMGDVGSGLLGFLIAVLALRSQLKGGASVVVWLIAFGVFLFDATVTLVRRLLNGERWYAAHRSHAYQRLANSGWGHSRVSIGILILNLVLAVLASLYVWLPAYGPLLALSAFTVLAICYCFVEGRAPMLKSDQGAADRAA